MFIHMTAVYYLYNYYIILYLMSCLYTYYIYLKKYKLAYNNIIIFW